MARQPWRVGNGLAVVILWTVIVGFPILVFHITRSSLTIGEHLHSTVLFLASQGLVFWLVARPPTAPPPTASSRSKADSPTPPLPTISPQVWEAEVVNPRTSNLLFGSGSPGSECPTVEVFLSNYIGSSKARIIYLDPSGRQFTLLAGQELHVQAAGQYSPPVVRVIESDLATQLCISGATHVTARLQEDSHRTVSEALPSGEAHDPS